MTHTAIPASLEGSPRWGVRRRLGGYLFCSLPHYMKRMSLVTGQKQTGEGLVLSQPGVVSAVFTVDSFPVKEPFTLRSQYGRTSREESVCVVGGGGDARVCLQLQKRLQHQHWPWGARRSAGAWCSLGLLAVVTRCPGAERRCAPCFTALCVPVLRCL